MLTQNEMPPGIQQLDPPIGTAKALARARRRRRRCDAHGVANRVRKYLRRYGLEDVGELCRRLRISREMLHQALGRRDVTAVLRRRAK